MSALRFPWILLGDRTTHGGQVVSAYGKECGHPMTVGDGKVYVACIGDKVVCPKCKGVHTIIANRQDTWRAKIDDRIIAIQGDYATDGSQLIASQNLVAHVVEAELASLAPKQIIEPSSQIIVPSVATDGFCLECALKAAAERNPIAPDA